MFGQTYLRGTLTLLVLTELIQFSGYNLFNMFSVRVFTQLNELATVPVPANFATQMTGLWGFFAIMFSLYVSRKVGRKFLFVIGCGMLAVILGLISLSMALENSQAALVMAVLLYVVYDITIGAVHWFYYAEVSTDRQLGFIASAHYFGGVINSLLAEYLMGWLKP